MTTSATARATATAALTRLGKLLVAEESTYGGVPAQVIRYIEQHWPVEDDERLLTLRAERDAALARGNRLAAELAEIETAGNAVPPAAGRVCSRRGCTNLLPPPRLGPGAPRRLCLECGPRRRPLKRSDLAASWAEAIVTANPKGEGPR